MILLIMAKMGALGSLDVNHLEMEFAGQKGWETLL